MIRIEGLEFSYAGGGFRLSLPELSVEGGETVAIVGPSGSGKTTLLHLIAGIERPVAGRIRVGETDLTALGEARRRDFRIRNIGLVFQEFELLDYLDAEGNILLPYRIHPALALTAAVRARAAALAEDLGVRGLCDRTPDRLSHGERQRVALCRALLPEPRLLLADEPTGNLDPAAKAQVLDLLLSQARERNATLLMVTHDHALLGRFGRVVTLPTGAGR